MKYREYCELVIKRGAPENRGYIYITTDELYLPFYRVDLRISKRRPVQLNLLEEIVIRLSAVGANEIDTQARILGIDRDIIDITIADLYSKELAFHSAGKCILMAKGRQMVNNIKQFRREIDYLQDVYMNAVTGEISGKVADSVTNRGNLDSSLIKHKYLSSDIDEIRKQTERVKEIFLDHARSYLPEGNEVADELVSIDEITNANTRFVKLVMHIYVGETGQDIDLVVGGQRNKYFTQIKSEVLSQFKTGRVLNNLFVDYYEQKSMPETEAFVGQQDVIRSVNQILAIEGDEAIQEAMLEKVVFSNRYLLDNEIIEFCELAFDNAQNVVFEIDQLETWSKRSLFLTIASMLKPPCASSILYANCYNEESKTRAIKRISRSAPNSFTETIEESKHDHWMRITINRNVIVTLFPSLHPVLNEDKFLEKTLGRVSVV